MNEMHVHGGDIYRHKNVIDFSANCNPYGTPEAVKKAVKKAMDGVGNYPDTACEALRKALSEYEGVPEKNIICGNGAADLIFLLALAVKPHKALLPAPVFAEYEQALASVECVPEHYFMRESEGFTIRYDFLNRITNETDLVFLCNPNNPTGVLLDREFLLDVLKRCRDCGAILMLDECFVDFTEEPEKHTIKDLLESYPELFILKAFTKRYAMAGVRLGYALSANRSLLSKMNRVCQPWNVSSLAQEAGIAALKETEYVERTRKMIREQRNFLITEMKKAGYEIFQSAANYIFFRGPDDLYEHCLEQGFLIRDCSNYIGLGRGFYRIAVKKQEENEALLQVLTGRKDNG